MAVVDIQNNDISVNQVFARNAFESMHNKLQFFKLVDRQLDSQWANNTNGYAQGDSYQIQRPARFKSRVGNTIGDFQSATGTWETGDFVEDPITFAVSKADQINISTQFTSKDKTLALTDLKSRLGEGVGLQMATDLEKKVVGETVVKGGGYILATAGAASGSKIGIHSLLLAQARLDELATPTDKRSVLLPSAVMADLSREHQGLFTPNANEKIAISGYVNSFAGADMFSYNLLPKIVLPASAAVITVTTVSSSATEALAFTVTSDANVTLPAGAILEFDESFMVNPETRESTGVKYSFSLTEQLVLVASTESAIVKIDAAAKIWGPLDIGNRQNIDVLPVATKVVKIVGVDASVSKTYNQAVMFQENAYTATVIPLTTDLPGASAARADHDGFSIRTCVATSIGTDTVIHRFDGMAKGILQRDTYAVRILVEV